MLFPSPVFCWENIDIFLHADLKRNRKAIQIKLSEL